MDDVNNLSLGYYPVSFPDVLGDIDHQNPIYTGKNEQDQYIPIRQESLHEESLLGNNPN